MRYYKIIIDDKFVGIGSTIDLRKFQKKHEVFLSCDESEAQYIQCGEQVYHDNWMLPCQSGTKDFLTADVVEIDKSEYEVLYKAVEANEDIQILDEPEEQEPAITEPDVTVEYVKESKINEMNSKCNKMIVDGFDIKLSDNNMYHFSLTLQDQLNLITSAQMISNGVQKIPYHADGCACKYYSINDMGKIIEMANLFKTYHISYFNSLKSYIESLQDMEIISAVSYGDEIPEEYQSTVYVELKNKLGL